MSEEIKLILTKLKLVSEIEESGAYICDKEHSKLLLDYITNLQEENNIIDELEKWAKENNINNRDIYGYEMEDTKVIYLEDFLNKLKELKGEQYNKVERAYLDDEYIGENNE